MHRIRVNFIPIDYCSQNSLLNPLPRKAISQLKNTLVNIVSLAAKLDSALEVCQE